MLKTYNPTEIPNVTALRIGACDKSNPGACKPKSVLKISGFRPLYLVIVIMF
jgi:hypothetical protein